MNPPTFYITFALPVKGCFLHIQQQLYDILRRTSYRNNPFATLYSQNYPRGQFRYSSSKYLSSSFSKSKKSFGEYIGISDVLKCLEFLVMMQSILERTAELIIMASS